VAVLVLLVLLHHQQTWVALVVMVHLLILLGV